MGRICIITPIIHWERMEFVIIKISKNYTKNKQKKKW